MSNNISVKLPKNIITIHLPALQTDGATTSLSGNIRQTEQGNIRVTRGGNTRVTRDYTITVYPELVVLKIQNGVISVNLPPAG